MSIFIERTGELIGTRSTNLTVDISTTAVPPVYATMLTAVITTVRPSSYLDIRFAACILHTGVAGVNAAPTFRARLNRVLVPVSRATTVNTVASRYMPVVLERRVIVSAGVQTVIIEWAKFGAPFNTMRCQVVTFPDIAGAQLVLQEQAS